MRKHYAIIRHDMGDVMFYGPVWGSMSPDWNPFPENAQIYSNKQYVIADAKRLRFPVTVVEMGLGAYVPNRIIRTITEVGR